MDSFIKQKKTVKKLFAEKLSFSFSQPLIAVILDKELSEKEEILIKNVFEGVSHLQAKIIVLSDHQKNITEDMPVICLPYSRRNRKHLLEAADMALAFSFNDVEEMLLNGTIPISGKRKELESYNPNHESGNAFIYDEINHWSIFAAVVRAVETFKFPYDWKGIVRQGLDLSLVSH